MKNIQQTTKATNTDCVNTMNPKHYLTLKWPVFQLSTLTKNRFLWYKLLKNVMAKSKERLLTQYKLKLVNYLLLNQRLTFLKKCDFSQFWSKMAQNFNDRCWAVKNDFISMYFGLIILTQCTVVEFIREGVTKLFKKD